MPSDKRWVGTWTAAPAVTSQHDPTELSPILLITIDNNGNRWILSDILQALERRAEASFELCINRDVKRVVADRKTHRYDMRSCITIGCREMTDPQILQKQALYV